MKVVRHKRRVWTTESVVYGLLGVAALLLLIVGAVIT